MMKIIVASSNKNRIEERVAVYSLLQCGHTIDQINIIDGDNGYLYDALRENELAKTNIKSMGNSTSFTMARLYLPLFYQNDDRIVIIDSDVIVYKKLDGIFGDGASSGIYVRKAYASDEWATSVMGWLITPKIRNSMGDYSKLIESEDFSWRDKIYLKKNFSSALGINITRLSKCWNSFEAAKKNTNVVHFTNLRTQPWKKSNHPYENNWFSLAQKAFKENFLKEEDISIQEQYGELREDFRSKLLSEIKPVRLYKRIFNHVELFYRNMKFHSPIKYFYSEFIL